MRYRLTLTDDQGIVIASWPLESNPESVDLEDDNDLSTPDEFGREVQREITVHESGICQRCGAPLADGRCSDETCPFSDCAQTDPQGWIGHPDHEPTT